MRDQSKIIILLLFLNQIFSQIQLQENSPYNEEISKEIYTYARIAFCSEDQIRSWNCGRNCQEQHNVQEITVLSNDIFKIYGFSAYSTRHNAVILSFRGSSNIKNDIADALFIPIQYPRCSGCLVHAEGFYLGFETIKKQMNLAVRKILNNHPGASFIVTGHSLGAAISTFAALEAQITFGNVKYFYNYGAPRVGNKKFADFLMSKITTFKARVVHNQDIVPHAPMRWLGFHHYGNEIFYNKESSQWVICDNTGEDPKCSNKFVYKYKNSEHTYYLNRTSSCGG